MQYNVYFNKLNAVFMQSILMPSPHQNNSHLSPQSSELQCLLKKNPLRLDLALLQLDVLSLEYADNLDQIFKELVFLFSYSNIHKHKWIINAQGAKSDTLLEFIYYIETTLFDILVDIEEGKYLKKYQKIVQVYLPNTYYAYYIKALCAKKDRDFKLAYYYAKKSLKQRGHQENILIQMQDICKKLDKTKEYKKYTEQYERLVL